mmetsp:Transcript_2372/g.3321  ORF Transcript_2372/g.3321 Transcript_2372/m.3321 type:complete len:216 (-) Transcript_2372:461-1108(-)
MRINLIVEFVLLAALSFGTSIAAFGVSSTGSITSSFGGSVLVVGKECANSVDKLTMKKGKANVPPQMRGQYKRQKELSEMREQMMEAQKPGADGLPVFNLYVRTERANMWYPCGSFKGDDRSAALCANYRDNGFLSGISKNQLDAGVSGSLFRDESKLKETIFRGYPQLRKSKDSLEFGYKLAYDGLNEEQSKICAIELKEQKGFLDGFKTLFNN